MFSSLFDYLKSWFTYPQITKLKLDDFNSKADLWVEYRGHNVKYEEVSFTTPFLTLLQDLGKTELFDSASKTFNSQKEFFQFVKEILKNKSHTSREKRRLRNCEPHGYIYVLASSDRRKIKIGYSGNLPQRLSKYKGVCEDLHYIWGTATTSTCVAQIAEQLIMNRLKKHSDYNLDKTSLGNRKDYRNRNERRSKEWFDRIDEDFFIEESREAVRIAEEQVLAFSEG